MKPRKRRQEAADVPKTSPEALLNDPRFSQEAAALIDRRVLLPPEQQRYIYEIVKALALPMDPSYRAYELNQAQRADERDA